jgi:hypothetical protein
LKITEVAKIFALLFSPEKMKYLLILTKKVFGYILGVFSQTHLVTLLEAINNTVRKEKEEDLRAG